jgi:hypothetical protein
MARKKLDIPDDWPRPWQELGEGELIFMGIKILMWKKYHRHAKFKIYGFSKAHYIRVWYGRKVLHFSLLFKRVKNEGTN